MSLVVFPRQFLVDVNGAPRVGANAHFYQSGTTTEITTYTTPDFDAEHSNPVESAPGGLFPVVYINPAVNPTYKIVVTDSEGAEIYSEDEIPTLGATAADIGSLLYPVSTAEEAAGFAAVDLDLTYKYGNVFRYGAVGDNSTNDAAAFQMAADVSASHEMYIPEGSYLVNDEITFPSTGHVRVRGEKALVRSTVVGQRLFQCSGVSSFTLDGVRFQGAGSSTSPTGTFDGYAATSTGLVTVTDATDVRITDCKASDFYNGFVVLNSDGVWIQSCEVTDWLTYGILASMCNDFHIDFNRVVGCDQTGAVNAYGIMATGDQNGSNTQRAGSIIGNVIRDVPSWDGIMTHDCDGLTIALNDIRNVRMGIDVGHFASTNVVKNVHIIGNYVESTTTDSWSAAAAQAGAIICSGYDASNRIDVLVVANNTCRGFFGITGATYSGNPSVISVGQADNVSINGNVCTDIGGVTTDKAGIFLFGTMNCVSVTGGSLKGAMGAGGVRLAGVTADLVSIKGVNIKQTTASDAALNITGSTISGLAVGDNPTNSSAPFAQATSTLTYTGTHLIGAYTGTLTGCSTSPTGSIEWSIDGDQVTLEIPAIEATSNTTAATITGMPAEIRPAAAQSCLGICKDNGTAAISKIEVGTSGTLTLHNALSATFTGSGTKGVGACVISYRRS